MLNLFKKHPVYEKANEVSSMLEESQRLRAAARQCGEQLAQRQAALEISKRNFARSAAEQFMGQGAGDGGGGDSLYSAEQEVDRLAATLSGLQTRLKEIEPAMRNHLAELEGRFAAWRSQRIAEFARAEYEKAVKAFAEANRKLMAIAIATGDEQARKSAEMAAAYSPVDGSFILESPRTEPYSGTTVSPNWEHDPKAKQIHDEDVKLKRIMDAASQEIRDLEHDPARENLARLEEELRKESESNREEIRRHGPPPQSLSSPHRRRANAR